MKRFLILAMFALAALAPLWKSFTRHTRQLAADIGYLRDRAVESIGFAFAYVSARIANTETGTQSPARLLVSAKAFMLRIAKRQSPRIESTWRMCPSI